MLYLGICDDERECREQIYEMFSHAFFQYDEIETTYFKNAEEIIEDVEKGQFQADLLLLDIHMPGKSGLKLAEYIRLHQVDVDIIFITVSPDYVFDGYTYQAFTYLLKPLDYGRIQDEVRRYMELKTKNSDCLHISINGRRERIFLNEVFYISVEGRKVLFHRRDGEIAAYAKLNDLEETLRESGFIRCHQSFLINKKFVQSHSRMMLTVAGEEIPISRRYIESVREAMKTEEGGKI
ncbi:MAG: LytTR family DNA-binding domain-containing protein [Roseburia sp.]|nr:LytTR family DNA-binding domain-containing protein [Roseburia sp.]